MTKDIELLLKSRLNKDDNE